MSSDSSDSLDSRRRVGRISLDEGRRILTMISSGDTLEAVATVLQRSPKAIETKAKSLGIVPASSAWRDQRQAICAALLAKKSDRSTLRAGEPWSLEDDCQLRNGICEGRSAGEIAHDVQRTTRAVRRRVELLHLSWTPPRSA